MKTSVLFLAWLINLNLRVLPTDIHIFKNLHSFYMLKNRLQSMFWHYRPLKIFNFKNYVQSVWGQQANFLTHESEYRDHTCFFMH